MHEYNSNEGALGGAWRGMGIARALMAHQHQWAAEEGYRTISTQTFHRFFGMLVLNLRVGFQVVGLTHTGTAGGPKLHLRKRLCHRTD